MARRVSLMPEGYGFLLCPGFKVGVGSGTGVPGGVMPGGSVGVGRPDPDGRGPLGEGDGEGDGDGDGDGLGQGCEPMTFQE